MSGSSLLKLGVAGPITFVLTWLIAGLARTDYSAVDLPVSALALGPEGWMMTAGFLICGLASIGFALGVRKVSPSLWSWVWFLTFGAGLVLSGIFEMDPTTGYPPGEVVPEKPSAENDLHDVAGLTVFGSLALAGVSWSVKFRHHGDTGWAIASLVAGIGVAALITAFGIIWDADGSGAGLVQRAAIVLGWGWIVLLAIHLIDAGQSPSSNQGL